MRHAFVRRIDLSYQSSIGGRRWQSGIDVLGPLRERPDHVVAWQMRAFAAEGNAAGANFGLIYRHVAGEENLAGVNVFLDYEDHEYGDFWRWSYGGELRGPWGGIYANHYLALTNERDLGDGYVAYSQSGMDVAAEISPLGLRWFRGGLTYYHWQGEHGEEDDRGLRYHTGFDFSRLFGGGDFWGGLSFDVEYDHPESGDGDWGGRVAYTHRFGTPTAGGESVTTDDFDPRSMFFDPVRREYAQRIKRIKKVKIFPGTPAVVTAVAGGGLVNGEGVTVGAASRTFYLEQPATVTAFAASTLEITASSSQPWTITVYKDTTLAFREQGSAVDLIGGGFSFDRAGGSVTAGVGNVSMLSSPNLTVEIFGTQIEMRYRAGLTRVDLHEGIFLITIAGRVADNLSLGVTSDRVTVKVVASDLTITLSSSFNSFVSYGPADVTINVPMGIAGTLHQLTLTGGDSSSYAATVVNNPGDWAAGLNGSVVAISRSTAVDETTSLTVEIEHNFGRLTVPLVFHASSVSGGEFYVGAEHTGPIASLSLGFSGGDESYGSELINSSSASLSLSDSNELSAVSGFPAPATVVVTARVSGNLGSSVDVPFTLFGVPRLSLSSLPPTGRNVRLSGDAAFFTLAVSGGRPPYRFSASGPLSVNAAGVVAVRPGDDADIGSAQGSVFVENGVVVIGGNRLATVVAFNYYKPIHYAPASVTVEAAASVTVTQNLRVPAVGGGLPGGTTTYSAVSTEPSTAVVLVDGSSGQVRLASKLSLEALVTVRIRATQGDDVATLVLVIRGADRPILSGGLRAFYPVPQGTVAVTLTTLDILGNFPPYVVGFDGGDAARFMTVVNGGNTVVVFDGDNTPGVRTSELRITDSRATVTSAYDIVVSVFAPLSFPTYELPVRVADDYVGFIRAYPAENGYGTRRYSTATDGASVGETDARLSLTTVLGNTNLPVTIVAQDDTNVTAFLTVELQSVPELVITPISSVLYVPVGAVPNTPLLTMEATGGDPSGLATAYLAYSVDPGAGLWVAFDRNVLVVGEAPPVVSTVGRVRVRGTDFAVGNDDFVTVTVQFYEEISFLSNPVTQSVPKVLPGIAYDVEPQGGSGAYGYSVVTVVDSAGRGISVSVDDDGEISLAAPMATTTAMSVVVAVRDRNIPSAMALLTVVLEGVDGLFIRTRDLRQTAPRYYVSSEAALPYAVVSLIAVGGVTPYRWGLAAGEDADGLLAFGTGGTLTTVNVRAQPTSLRAESFVLTVGETTGTLAASVTLTMEFYAPLSVALPMGSRVIPEENFVGTLTVAKIHDGTAGDVDVRRQVAAIGGRFEDYFDAPVVGEAVVDSNGRRYRPVGLGVKQVLPHTLTAFVTLVVLDRADGRRQMVAVTVRGKIPFTQSKPLGLHTVPGGAPIRANEPTVGITVLDLDDHFKDGERPYTYIIDGRNLEVSSENELIYNGGGLLDTRGTATVVASDADGDSVTAALTLAFSIPVGFVPATVTQTIAAGYVGAVYAAAARGSHDPIAWINDKLWVGTRVLNRAYGEFDYSIVTPAYDTAGRAVPVSSSRQTVSLGQGLAAGSRLTVTVVAQGAVLRNNPWRASLDLILVAAPAPSATLSAWFTQLLTGEGNRVVASLHTSGYPDPVVSLVAGGDAFAYLAGTRLLSVSVTRSSAASESATLEVSDRGLGWPAVRVTHTLGWVSSGVAAADLSLAGTLEAAHAIPVAATTPMALGTLSVSGGRGSYSAVVRQTGGALAVDLNGGVAVVRLVSVGASGTEIRATLAVDDGIPGGAVERVITVLFYAPAAYAPSLVTVDVAAQALLWQRAYAVPATGGFGEGFRYSVLTVVGDKPVSVDMERGVVWLDTDDGGRLGSGKTLTAEIEATDVRVESNRAVLTVVMAGSIFPTFSEFDVQDGSRLVYFIKVGTTALVRQGLGVRGGGSPVVTMESAAAENYEHKVGGILSLTVAQDSPTVHRLTIHTYDSGQPAATRITVSRVLTVVIHDPLQGVAQPFLFVARTLPAGASVGMATVGGGGGSVTWSKAGGDANNLLTVRSDGRIGLVRQPTSGVGRGFYLEVQKVIRAEDEAGDSQTATVNVQFHRPLRWGNASRLRVIAGESVRSIDVPTDIGTHALFDFSNGARGGFDLSSTVRVIEAALTQHLTTPPFNIELEDGPGNLRIIPTSSNERVDHEARSRMRWSVNPINSYIKFEVVSWYTDFTGTRVTARATFRAVARGPVSLVSPLGSRNLLAGTAITQTVIADLSSHLHGGLPTYRGVADDAALTVSAGALLYVGGARAAGSVLTVTMALSDYLVAGHVNATVRTGVTLRFRPAVSFDVATVTKRIGAGFVGAVFAPTVAGGVG